MGVIFDSASHDIIAFIITISICIYTYFKWTFQYWKRRDIPYLQPRIPFGTLHDLLWNRKAFADLVKEQYKAAKARGCKHIGLFFLNSPAYQPLDLQYIKNIMTKDFDLFMDRGLYYNEKDDPLSAHLFNLEGAKWRNLRAKLTPTFTSGKMKMMFHTLTECGKQLDNYMQTISSTTEPIDIKEILGCFTTDVIASCAFGIECNSFKDVNSEFRRNLKRTFVITPLQMLRVMTGLAAPNLARLIGVRVLPDEVADYFLRVVREAVEYRETNNFVRKDFLQLLLDLKNNVLKSGDDYQHDGKSLTIDELAAQAFLFLGAGFETSSTTMTFCLYELSINQDIQERVRKEINSALERYGGNLTYDAIMEMKYMTQVVEETLRKYPPVFALGRVCLSDYKIPDTDIVIKKGTSVMIPVIGLQMDEDYFPEPERFDPERFSEGNKHKIPHFSYMPFGEGPRICMGLRFGMMQVKVGLAVLLKNYAFKLNEKTTTPLKMDPSSFVPSAFGGIWLDAEKLN